jgi:DNA-binding PadR family transcriptional regulator
VSTAKTCPSADAIRGRDVEGIDLNTLGNTDSTTVNDLSGTDLVEINVNQAATIGGSQRGRRCRYLDSGAPPRNIPLRDISPFVRTRRMERANLPEFGRFAEPALLILVSLSEGPKHGYAVMTDIEAGTGRPMGPGTLYSALARLEERGLIEPLAPVDRRRPYRLTGLGASVLQEQLTELSAFAALGLQRLADRPG